MGTTERLVVDLPSDVVTTLREAVQRGDFDSESEAVSAILRIWHGDADIEGNLGTIRTRVAKGLAEADAGEFVDANEVHAELRAKIKSASHRGG